MFCPRFGILFYLARYKALKFILLQKRLQMLTEILIHDIIDTVDTPKDMDEVVTDE